jgi:biotin transporter BioY
VLGWLALYVTLAFVIGTFLYKVKDINIIIILLYIYIIIYILLLYILLPTHTHRIMTKRY